MNASFPSTLLALTRPARQLIALKVFAWTKQLVLGHMALQLNRTCHCYAARLDVCVLPVLHILELLLQVCRFVGAGKAVAVRLLACLSESLDLW